MLIAWAIVAQALVQRWWLTGRFDSLVVIGLPPLLEVTVGQTVPTRIDVAWFNVLAGFAGAWLIAMPIGRLMTDAGVTPQHQIILPRAGRRGRW